jgi:MFS family permease
MNPRPNQPRIPLHPSDRHGRTRRFVVAVAIFVAGALLLAWLG